MVMVSILREAGEVGMTVLLILLVGVCMICLMYISADIEKIRKLVEREWQD